MWQRSGKGKSLSQRNKFEHINLSKLYIKVSSNYTENKTFRSYKDVSPNISSVALRPNAGHGFLILEVSGSHTATHHSR